MLGINKMVKSANKSVALVSTVAPVAQDYAALVARIIATSPEAAQAIALMSLTQGTRKARSAPAAQSGESESERANRCAQFSDKSERGIILAALIAALGEKDNVSLTEGEICEATKLVAYRARPSLDIVRLRLNDLHNAKFPLVAQIGYTLSVEGERGQPKIAHFSRIVEKAKARKAKAKAMVVAPSPSPVATTEGENKGE
jgi:hypothetical protein